MQARTIYRRHRDCELGLWIKVTFGAGRDAAGGNTSGLRLLAFSWGKFRATERQKLLRRSICFGTSEPPLLGGDGRS